MGQVPRSSDYLKVFKTGSHVILLRSRACSRRAPKRTYLIRTSGEP